MLRAVASALLCAQMLGASLAAQRTTRAALAPGDVDAIAQLVMLEDTRQFDADVLQGLLRSENVEVRRRAIVSVGRIVNPAGRALLVPLRKDANQDIVATVAFATGQLKDPDAVSWLAEVLLENRTPAAVGKEAAQALGKIRTPEARLALAKYLAAAADSAATAARRRRSPSRHRPVHDARGHRADRSLDQYLERRGPLARCMGTLPAARSGGCPASPEADIRSVRRRALLGHARSGADARDGGRSRSGGHVSALARGCPRSGPARADRGPAFAGALRRHGVG